MTEKEELRHHLIQLLCVEEMTHSKIIEALDVAEEEVPIVDEVLEAAGLDGDTVVRLNEEETSLRHALTAEREITRLTRPVLERFAGRTEHPDLAAALDMPPHLFARAFKATTGVSPYQHALNRRIDRVRDILAEGDAPLAEIAFLAKRMHKVTEPPESLTTAQVEALRRAREEARQRQLEDRLRYEEYLRQQAELIEGE